MSTIWSKKVITCMAGAILYVCNVRFRMSAAQVRGVPHYTLEACTQTRFPKDETKLVLHS